MTSARQEVVEQNNEKRQDDVGNSRDTDGVDRVSGRIDPEHNDVTDGEWR